MGRRAAGAERRARRVVPPLPLTFTPGGIAASTTASIPGIMSAARDWLGLVKDSAKDFSEDECPRSAAALSYSTIFALPPLLTLLIMVAGAIWDPAEVQRALEGQFAGLIGQEAGGQIRQMIQQADRPDTGGPLTAVLGIGALVFGATGAFMALQGTLNRVWEVAPDPKKGGLKNFVFKRLLSAGMILGIAFMLLVSLALSAMLGAFGGVIARLLPDGMSAAVLYAMNFAVSFAVITALFAAIFKVLPDAEVRWKDVWVGAAFTAFLFVLGKFALGLYLGQSNPGSAFGAAGALAVILVWIYYASMILLFGAEFTQKWALSRGHEIVPEEGAVRVKQRLERDDGESLEAGKARRRDRVVTAGHGTRPQAAPAPARGTPIRPTAVPVSATTTAPAPRGAGRALLRGLATYGVMKIVSKRLGTGRRRDPRSLPDGRRMA